MSRRPKEARVINWQRDVARSLSDGSEISQTPHQSNRSFHQQNQARVVVTQPAPYDVQMAAVSSNMASSKALIGTLLGATAGATIAYAMTKAEAQDNAATATTTTYRVQSSPQCWNTNTFPAGQRSSVSQRSRPTSIYSQGARQYQPQESTNTLATTITTFISSLNISPTPIRSSLVAAPVPTYPAIKYQPAIEQYTVSEPSTVDRPKRASSRVSRQRETRDYEITSHISSSRASRSRREYEDYEKKSRNGHRQRGTGDYSTTSRVSSKHSRRQLPDSASYATARQVQSSEDPELAQLVALPDSISTVYSDCETALPGRYGGSRVSRRSRKGDGSLAPSDSISQVSSRYSVVGSSRDGRRHSERPFRRNDVVEW